MEKFFKRQSFFFLIILIVISIDALEWFIIMNKWITYNEPGQPGYFLIALNFLHLLYRFTTISFCAILICFLFFRNRLDALLIKNIYMSLVFLVIIAIIIELSF